MGRWFRKVAGVLATRKGEVTPYNVRRAAGRRPPAAGSPARPCAGGERQPGLCGPRGVALILLTPAGALAEQSAPS